LPYFYNDADLTRKFRIIKNNLYSDGFYRDKVVCRAIETTDGDDIYDRDAVIEITDVVVNAIVEHGPIFNTYNNMVEIENADIKLTVRADDSIYINSANEIWIGCTIVGSLPLYSNETTKEISQGSSYIVRSKKPSIQNLDDIYILGLKGNLE